MMSTKCMVTSIHRSPSYPHHNNKGLFDSIVEIARSPEQLNLWLEIATTHRYRGAIYISPGMKIWSGTHIYSGRQSFMYILYNSWTSQPGPKGQTTSRASISYICQQRSPHQRSQNSSPLGGSVHIMIEADLNITHKDDLTTYTKHNYDKRNYKEMRNCVTSTLESVPQTEVISELWEWLIDTLNQARDKSVPHNELNSKGDNRQLNHYDWKHHP